MPMFVLWIGSILLTFLRAIGPTILATLGIAMVTQTVVGNVALPQVAGYFTALPDYAVQTLGAMNADKCFSIIFSAVAVRASMRFANAVRFKRRGGVPAGGGESEE